MPGGLTRAAKSVPGSLSAMNTDQRAPRGRSLKKIRSMPSFENLHTKLVESLKENVVSGLKKDKALTYSSAFKSPNNPCVVYSIQNDEAFFADEVFAKMMETGVHGIPVFHEERNVFVGCVELVTIAHVLFQGREESPLTVDGWMSHLHKREVSDLAYKLCTLVSVHTVSESATLFDVAVHLMAPAVHRVFLHDDANVNTLVAVISESDLVSYFHSHETRFALADGSEIPWMANEMTSPGGSRPAKNAETIVVRIDDPFHVALELLFESKLYSLPVCEPVDPANPNFSGRIVNSFCITDLKNFFYKTAELEGRSWDEPVQAFLASACGKVDECQEVIASSTLGVPVTRVLEIMSGVNAHTVFITDVNGVPVGQMGVTDICAFIATDIQLVTPSASPFEAKVDDHDLPLISETEAQDYGASATEDVPGLSRRFSTGIEEKEEKPSTTRRPSMQRVDSVSLKHGLSQRHMRHLETKNVRNQIQLITYPDCFGGNLEGLQHVLNKHLGGKHGVVGGVHVLPFYPSSADRGFAPQDYHLVDPTFGEWSNIEDIAKNYDVLADFMVNHISQKSEYFQDFLDNRDLSLYHDLFIRYKDFWPNGEPTAEDLALIYTRKPRAPYFDAQFRDGLDPPTEKVWCTFDFEQIDIDVTTETGRNFIQENLEFLCSKGLKFIRLDAFGYATKKLGTRCFMEEPEVWELLGWLGDICQKFDVEVLAEIHEHYTIQLKLSQLAGGRFWVYDFALPMLLLQSLYDSNCLNLVEWLKICPHNQLTTLDTHDGIGVVDVKDLMTETESTRTYNNLYKYGANVKRIYSSAKYTNLDIYQINCTYYSAVGNNDDWYLLCRAVQFFAPGIPQVYYVGLLCGPNDIELVERTRVGRDINRHNYSLEEVDDEIANRSGIQRLFKLCRFRNSYPAFGGDFVVSMLNVDNTELEMKWTLNDKCYTILNGNFVTKALQISYFDQETDRIAMLDLA